MAITATRERHSGATLEQILERMNALDIQRVKLGGVDVDGILRGKYVSRTKFDSIAKDGFGFCDVIFGWDSNDVVYDNVTFTGLHTGYPDTAARVDLDTFRMIPWEPQTAFFLADFVAKDGAPLGVSPRQVLKRVVDRARALGYQPTLAAEYEFFFFRETSHSIRDKDYRGMQPFTPGMFGYSVLRTGANAEFVHDVMNTLDAFDIDIEGFHTETGPGVYEAAIRYDDAVRAADKAVLFKTAIKQIAARHGLVATFMAKWNDALPGCGGHLHQSMSTVGEGAPVFHDDADPLKMSETMKRYVAGQVALMPEMTALVCPTINSYKRLVPGTWAPTTATWGVENRTTALRVIPGGPKSTRVEYRLAGSDANPYLAMAASLASGLYGIEQQLTLGERTDGSGYNSQAAPLPSTLDEATRRLAESTAARELLGDEFVTHFVQTREWEVRQFKTAVTDWERSRYFEVI